MKNIKNTLLAIVLVVVVAAAAYSVGVGGFWQTEKVGAEPVLYSQDTVTSIYEKAAPAVVEIHITEQSNGYFGSSFPQGLGSGFLIDKDGYILTNNHVVDGASSVQVKLSTGSTVKAEVLGKDAVHDLAVVKVDASSVNKITPLNLANSDTVKIGQMAIAIGNPYGLNNTVTVGVISGLNRTLNDINTNMTGMLQTDATLNPGNSGGPLLDVNGAVIGINTAIETGFMGSGASGIGFAVPSNVASGVLSDLKASKTVTRPWLGVSIRTLDATQATSLKLSITEGVVVVSVVADGPAAKAGVVANDVITAVNGTKITTSQELQSFVNTKAVGAVITLSVVRGSDNKSIAVTLGERPSSTITDLTPQTPRIPNQMPFPNVPKRGGGRVN